MEHREYRKLHAEWYELVSGVKNHGKEIDFWVRSIKGAGEPALELGSGKGRILIPLLERGIDVVIAWRSKNKYDAATHLWERLFIVEKFVSGRLVQTEANERWGRYFTADEAVGFAETAGFEEIRASDWLTEDPPGKDSNVVTVRCRKPLE